jgi:hypothetical protein
MEEKKRTKYRHANDRTKYWDAGQVMVCRKENKALACRRYMVQACWKEIQILT